MEKIHKKNVLSCSLNVVKAGQEPGVQCLCSVVFSIVSSYCIVFYCEVFPCWVFPWFYCVAGVFMVQQVLLAAMLRSEGGRVSRPIYEGKNLSHMAPVLWASGKSI